MLQPTTRLGDHLIRVFKLLDIVRTTSPRRHPAVDPMNYPLLFALRTEPRRTSDLAETLHLDISTVSRQIATLVKHGFVERTADPNDARAAVLSLTTSGEVLLDDVRADRDRWLRDLLAHWSTADIDAFGGYLDRFASDLSDSLTERSTR